MKPLHRRLIYIAFVIIFLIVTPLVILYTQGYRYNFKRGRLQKTGILIISSLPRQAAVFLNNQSANKSTPARLEQLLPGDYEIKLTKDGYHDWQKKLPITENATTFAEKIILWKKALPIELAKAISPSWLAAPDKQKTVWLNENNELILLETGNDQLAIISSFEKYEPASLIAWSKTSKKILLKTAKDNKNVYFVLNIEQKPVPKLKKIAQRNYQQVNWDQANDNLLYGLDQSGLWQIDLFTNQEKLISPLVKNNFLVKDGKLYFCQADNLYQQAIGEKNLNKLTNALPCLDYQIIGQNADKLILFNQQNQNVVFVDLKNNSKPIAQRAKNFDWLDDNTLLFYNDWEIWIYNLKEKKEPELVTRLGANLQAVIWHSLGRHLIFASDNKIEIIELDNRELRNLIELAQFKNINGLSLDRAGNNLYINGTLFAEPGVFKLNLR